ncbi:hypothetical protein [Halorubrum sp. FL23]|uniref:hypothetical protein n=1 Tax=Halorubrum sp. FL23 TaxID=3458704 RepID=UPI004033682B
MPVLHRRTDSDDYYVKGRLDGGFITLQLIRPAKHLLTEQFGYEDGDKISWKVMTPLCMLGHAYSRSGGGPGGDATGKDLSASINKLSSSQKRHLRQYLASYENYTPEERDWVNTHIFDGNETVSRNQISKFPESKQGPDEKVERLSSIWEDVIDGREQSDQDASRTGEPPRFGQSSQSSTQSSRSGHNRETNETRTGTTTSIDPSEIDLGSTLRVPVDRISNSGNVIVEVDGRGHLNLGDIPDVESGDEVRVEVTSTPKQGKFKANHVPKPDSPASGGLLGSVLSKLKTVF